jgi:hypothetical protein
VSGIAWPPSVEPENRKRNRAARADSDTAESNAGANRRSHPFLMELGTRRRSDMAMENYSKYQQSVIRNYYKNQDNVSLQRAQELLTDLYLSEGKKKEKVWDSLFNHLEKLGVPEDQLAHLRAAKNPELIAKLLEKKV